MLKEIADGKNLPAEIEFILSDIHKSGPVNPLNFEKLSLIKIFHPDILKQYEAKIISLIGLFYKTTEPKSAIELVYSLFYDEIKDNTGHQFTPTQASAYNQIRNKEYFSFSAPTSSGKSHLFRALIKETEGDIVIVVPSRALISEYYYEVMNLLKDDKHTLVLQFIDHINTKNTKKHVFIITPERGVELFKQLEKFNIKLFLLDEAQISEEPVRGMKFDSFVRRIDKLAPNSKKVFAHPFVQNPEAQLKKHSFFQNAAAQNYNQMSVGKVFLSVNSDNSKFNFFSPHIKCADYATDENTILNVMKDGGTLLVYIAKDHILDGQHTLKFAKYISMCPPLKNSRALEIIQKLQDFIGASPEKGDKYSFMIALMKRGIVTHHGSMPLKARLYVEEFVKSGFSRICFATSTLSQGINMPFDIVWIDNFHNMKPLTLKNLIGRSGRSSNKTNNFDYGYTVIKTTNKKTFIERYNEQYKISEQSLIENEQENSDIDLRDIVEAVKNNEFDDHLHLPKSQVERLSDIEIKNDIEFLLDNLLFKNKAITGRKYYEKSQYQRSKIKKSFSNIYIKHLRRESLEKGEMSILSAAIPMLLWHVQGRSFSEIVSLRHAYISKKDERRKIISLLKNDKITFEEAAVFNNHLFANNSPKPYPLPNSKLKKFVPLFNPKIPAENIDYDRIVYDTYDYLDKVVSFSLADPICAALEIYYNSFNDKRALTLKNYIRYGTDDNLEIWLIRYGFSFEDIEWIKDYIISIGEEGIEFKKSINELSDQKKEIIERYVY